MGMFSILEIAGSGMSAQTVRMNTTASNMANADSVSSSVGDTYRARHPVFATVLRDSFPREGDPVAGVRVAGIIESDAPVRKEYLPEHPSADEDGYIYRPERQHRGRDGQHDVGLPQLCPEHRGRKRGQTIVCTHPEPGPVGLSGEYCYG